MKEPWQCQETVIDSEAFSEIMRHNLDEIRKAHECNRELKGQELMTRLPEERRILAKAGRM